MKLECHCQDVPARIMSAPRLGLAREVLLHQSRAAIFYGREELRGGRGKEHDLDCKHEMPAR